MAENEITKTRSLATTFIIPAEEAKPYVRFGYGPLTIFNHTQGQFSGSMNDDPINTIHTIQQYTIEGLSEELEVSFISSKLKTQRTIFNK